mgnify:FL=1
MKLKIILILIVVLNTSFINTSKRVWLAQCSVRVRETFAWQVAKIVLADTEKEADKKFRKYLKSDPLFKNGYIENRTDRPDYKIIEIKKQDIIK